MGAEVILFLRVRCPKSLSQVQKNVLAQHATRQAIKSNNSREGGSVDLFIGDNKMTRMTGLLASQARVKRAQEGCNGALQQKITVQLRMKNFGAA